MKGVKSASRAVGRSANVNFYFASPRLLGMGVNHDIHPTEDNPVAYKGRRVSNVFHTERCCIVKQVEKGRFVPLESLSNPEDYSLCEHCDSSKDCGKSKKQTSYAKRFRAKDGLEVVEEEPQVDSLEVTVKKSP